MKTAPSGAVFFSPCVLLPRFHRMHGDLRGAGDAPFQLPDEEGSGSAPRPMLIKLKEMLSYRLATFPS